MRGRMATATVQDVLREIKDVKDAVEKLGSILEQRLIGVVSPTPEEKRAVRAYEAAKRRGEKGFVSLEEAAKQLRVHRMPRKKSH